MLIKKAWRISLAAAIVFMSVVTTVNMHARSASADSGFNPGNIIADELFYDGYAMNQAEVQQKLNDLLRPDCALTGVGGTVNSAGVLLAKNCLRDFGTSTPNIAGDRYCSEYAGASWQSAAEIITKVGQACGISQKVLLVTLQKETSLVTMTYLGQWRFDRAMGYACPDTGPGGSASCDVGYYGFFNQVYNAARAFKRYKYNPAGYNHQPYRFENLEYNVAGRGCGARNNVYIENYATAGLYNYTPYTPNDAILSGTGDNCSATGNLNFYKIYTQWFGSTQPFSVSRSTGIGALFYQLGGSTGPLRFATSNEVCGLKDQGCYQNFRGGAITWTPAGGAKATWGGIRDRWRVTGFENGSLGYPITNEVCGLKQGGCYQNFQGGAITWTPAIGAWETSGTIREVWRSVGFENSALGYPNGPVTSINDGRNGTYQPFQGGAIVSNPQFGTWATWGGIRAAWARTGFEGGTLGYPTGPEVCGLKSGGCYQHFEKGAITWAASTGGWETYGDIRATWATLGYENGPLGYPAEAQRCAGNLCSQKFQYGEIVKRNSAFGVWGGIYAFWKSQGGAAGRLGAPTTSEQVRTDGLVQQRFENGTVVWRSTGATIE